jgi:hypothetical protein
MGAKKAQVPAQNGTPVGYGKPPVHSRFRKGQSGNPTGKRRQDEAERAQAIILEEAFRLLTVREGDKVTRMPALQAVIRSQIASAAKGNVPAQRAIVKAIQEIEAAVRARGTAGVANRKLNQDADAMTDDALLAVLRAARHDKS